MVVIAIGWWHKNPIVVHYIRDIRVTLLLFVVRRGFTNHRSTRNFFRYRKKTPLLLTCGASGGVPLLSVHTFKEWSLATRRENFLNLHACTTITNPFTIMSETKELEKNYDNDKYDHFTYSQTTTYMCTSFALE